MCCGKNSNFTIDDKSTMCVSNNTAFYGGAVHMYSCEFTFKSGSGSNVVFSNNEAFIGGALK